MKKNYIIIATVSSIIGGMSVFILGQLIMPHIFDASKKQYNTNYPNLNLEIEVSEKLKKLRIPHEIDQNGLLHYSSLNEELVDLAYQYVYQYYIPDWEAINFKHEPFKKRYIRLLNENGIQFIIRKMDREGNDYILTDPLYDKQVKQLQKTVLKDFYSKKDNE
jgi:hypothetical protein